MHFRSELTPDGVVVSWESFALDAPDDPDDGST